MRHYTSKTFLNWKTQLIIALIIIVGVLIWMRLQGPEVRGYRVEPTTLVQQVVATGRVASDSRARIGSEITAVVVERFVERGQLIQKGKLLMSLRADDLRAQKQEAQAALELLQSARRPQAQARLAQAESQLAQALREAQRRRVLVKEKAITAEALEQAEHALAAAQANANQARLDAMSLASGATEETILMQRLTAAQAALAKTEIRAPFSGIVLQRHAAPGDIVQPGQALIDLLDNKDIELLVPIDERNLGVLQPGQKASVLADAYPAQPFNAHISRIAPIVDPQRGTVDVRLALDPVPDFIREDMTTTVTIETARADQAIAVPNDTLYEQSGNTAKLWKSVNGKAQQSDVTLGLRGLAMTQITEGLAEGDIVLGTSQALTAGQRIQIQLTPLPSARPPSVSARTDGEMPMKFN